MWKKRSKKDALARFKSVFSNYPTITQRLESQLQRREEILVDIVQINGDHLHYPILVKGPAYWYGIHTENKEGKLSELTRVCNYIGS